MRIRLSILCLLVSVISLAQIPGYDLNNVVLGDATNPLDTIDPITIDKLPADSTLDIVNWNVSFLGAPEFINNAYGNREEHINGVAQKLVEVDADVYALQEVVVDSNNGNALSDLVAAMNAAAGEEKYSGVYSEYHSFYWQEDDPEFPSQCLAFVWNTEYVQVNNDSALLVDVASQTDFGYGRYPFMIDTEIFFRGKTQRYFFIDLHLKAKTGFESERANSMELVRSLLEVNFYSNNIVLVGDYNVADNGGAIGEIQEWGMYEDREEDGLTDFVHVAGNKNTGIEHTLISNELYDELAYISPYDWNVLIPGTKNVLSDHQAYITSLYVHQNNSGTEPENNPIFDNSEGFKMLAVDYQIIVDFSNNNGTNTHSHPENSDDYYGASSFYSNFDIEADGSWNQSIFSDWQSAVKTGIIDALLPAKYPEAEVDGIIYSIRFDTWDGENSGSDGFEFHCIKAAPNPEFEEYTLTIKEEQNHSTLRLFPNPVISVLHFDRQVNNVSILNSLGKEIIHINGLIKEVDVSILKSGFYLLKSDNTVMKFYKE